MKYFWKNGYAHAMGITITIAMAMRTDSLGICALYCCSDTPAVGLLVIYSSERMILFSSACREIRFFLEMYSEDRNQSFQYPKHRNSEMVASSGLEMGMTMLVKMRSCDAPSIMADSTMPSGTVLLKKVLQMTML